PTLTLDDPLCTLAPADRDPGCPPDPTMGTGMEPPMCGDQPCPPPEGTVPMCAGPLDTMIPCPPPGGDGDSCAAEETPALVAACRANQTAAGN
ncbi:MAG: hypothetical protein ABGX43_09790, partial [Nitrospinaceae bacterium]